MEINFQVVSDEENVDFDTNNAGDSDVIRVPWNEDENEVKEKFTGFAMKRERGFFKCAYEDCSFRISSKTLTFKDIKMNMRHHYNHTHNNAPKTCDIMEFQQRYGNWV